MKCEDKDSGICYAAKRLKKKFKAMTDVSECAEIIAMQKLTKHPNILYMIEFHYDPQMGKVTFIFELMDMSMYDFMKLRKGRIFPESKVKNYLYQMLRGLDHLHKNGLFHRDIKPENILVKVPLDGLYNQGRGEVIKLADLGSIRGVYSRPPYTEYISTRWYRSPECLLTIGHYGPKMDVWAAGCVFYEMLTLKPLFPGTNEVDQLTKIHSVIGTPNSRLMSKFRKHQSRNCDYFPKQIGTGLAPLMPNVSEDGQQLLKLMIHYDPESRFNVRRVLEHKYFSHLREDEILHKHKRSQSLHANTKSKGDWVPRTHGSHSKYQHISSELGRVMAEDDHQLLLSRSSHRIRHSSSKPSNHGSPLNKKLLSNLGIDTEILKNRSRGGSMTKKAVGAKKLHHHSRYVEKESVAQEVAKKLSDPVHNRLPLAQHKFVSKSFVLPRRLPGKTHLATINEFPLTKVENDFSRDLPEKPSRTKTVIKKHHHEKMLEFTRQNYH